MLNWLFELGQATLPEIPTNIGTGAGLLTTGGIAAWYIYYKEAIAIPRERTEWRAQLKEQQTEFLRQLEETTERFDRTIREMKEDCTKEKLGLLEELKQERISRHTDSQATMACLNLMGEKIGTLFAAISGNTRAKKGSGES